jgi:hypothetical protein
MAANGSASDSKRASPTLAGEQGAATQIDVAQHDRSEARSRADEVLDRALRRNTGRGDPTGDRAHARPGDHVDRDAGRVEDFEDPEVREPECATRAEGHAHGCVRETARGAVERGLARATAEALGQLAARARRDAPAERTVAP